MLPRIAAVIATLTAVVLSIIHLWHPLDPFDTWSIRLIHLSLGMVIAFLTYPMIKGKKIGVLDFLFAGLAIVVHAYVMIFMDDIIARFALPTTMDLVMGAICIALVLEMTRRVIGLPMVIIAIVALLYAYFGEFIPGVLGHRGFSVSRIIDHLYLYLEGIFGVPIGVSATFVILFIIFGAFLQATKTGDFMMNIANSMAGEARGGPAKIAVVASGLFGSISGSAVANVAATGAYTIPLMKRTGYKSHIAGAVEAVASTGGQLMPPVMGAAAFVMAELTGIAYLTIIVAAFLPALLYFSTVQIAVHLIAVKTGLKGLNKDEILSFKRVIIEGGHLVIPLVVLIYMLAVLRMSPMSAAFWSIVAAVIISSLRKGSRMHPKALIKALEMGAKGALSVIAACACAGIIIGVITLTGLGLKLTSIIVDVGGGSVLLTLIVVSVAAYFLGMGLPTTAAYIIVAVLAAPALIELGVPVLAAHLFVFYRAIMSAITPPVALASIAGAGVAETDPMKTAVSGLKIALPLVVLPFAFVFIPPILIHGHGPVAVVGTFVVVLLSILCFTCVVYNWGIKALAPWERITLIVAASGMIAGLILESVVTGIIAFVLGAIVYLSQSGQAKRILQWRSASVKKP
ncbi:TRAP transporter permease [Dehalococcoidia bacterium]|nr:TRAP transporter permease [Dehalococcoidia bacterium]